MFVTCTPRPAAVLALAALTSCATRRSEIGSDGQKTPIPSVSASARAATSTPEPTPPPDQSIDLAVEGYGPAVLYAPDGTDPKPVVLATHGATDSPVPYCRFWRTVVKERAFVLCTRGLRMAVPDQYYYRDDSSMHAEAVRALSALRSRFGSRVLAGPVLYAGFSQGAIFGSSVVQKHVAEYPRAVLMEGGAGGWNRALARRYKESGGRKVLFVCGEHACGEHARRTAKVLNGASLDTKVIAIEDVGHTYTPAIADAIDDRLGWLLEGDDRWALGRPDAGPD